MPESVRFFVAWQYLMDKSAAAEAARYVGADRCVRPSKIMNLDNDTIKQLQEQLRLKDLAIEEMNHRFRNQLQIISNLLDIQASKSANAEVLDTLRQCRARVGSIVMVHDMLRQGDSAAMVDMEQYLKSLVAAIAAAWRGEDDGIKVDVRIAKVMLVAPRAAVLGLVVTELLTNSLKHAFVPGGKGQVTVEFGKKGGEMILVVKDDGRGLPLGDCPETAGRGGLRLTRSLVGQLKGSLKCENAPGAKVTVCFPV